MSERPPSLQERRRQAHAQMAAAILDASRQIMREAGACELNLAEVARRLDLQPPSLYEYFSGKGAIYDALYIQAFRELEARLQPVLEAVLPPWELLRIVLRVYLRFVGECPELYEVGFVGAVAGFAPSQEAEAVRQEVVAGIRDAILERWQSAGIEPDMGGSQALDLLGATAHGLAALHLASGARGRGVEGRYERLIPRAVGIFEEAWRVGREGAPSQNSWGIPI